MTTSQPPLPFYNEENNTSDNSYFNKLRRLLSEDLSFESQTSDYSTHGIHSFPAKFPPQLPNKFISELTNPGDVVLDPMAGSGTTILESVLLNRQAIGFDIDPLALLITTVKVMPLQKSKLSAVLSIILANATIKSTNNSTDLQNQLETKWDSKTYEFINYWFTKDTQIELLALLNEIEKIEDIDAQSFFKLVFSSIIITKSGGVSLAFDLGHTRPHRAKRLKTKTGIVNLYKTEDNNSQNADFLTKTQKSALLDFKKKAIQSINSVDNNSQYQYTPRIDFGNSEEMPLQDSSIDLIVTSPPYASNAIDYMRAHKFSLVWLGYPIDDLSEKRKAYIGSENTLLFNWEILPSYSTEIVRSIAEINKKKGLVLHRYYSEMTRVIREMYRVLKPGKSAIVVVGSSVLSGIDTKTQLCLAEIGESLGFTLASIGVRDLDRNKRMLPVSSNGHTDSQIQQRMHQEFVIGLYKPIQN